MPENAYRKGHLYEHLAHGERADLRYLFVGSNVPYGDGTGYCKRCGMNDPKRTSSCKIRRTAGSVAR